MITITLRGRPDAIVELGEKLVFTTRGDVLPWEVKDAEGKVIGCYSDKEVIGWHRCTPPLKDVGSPSREG
jgi:hypothetical protein